MEFQLDSHPSLFSHDHSQLPVWMDIGNGVFIKKFGRVWTKIHEQNMSINRFNTAQTPDMKVFYSQSFDSHSSDNIRYLTSRLV
jgi:hypothetical protein